MWLICVNYANHALLIPYVLYLAVAQASNFYLSSFTHPTLYICHTLDSGGSQITSSWVHSIFPEPAGMRASNGTYSGLLSLMHKWQDERLKLKGCTSEAPFLATLSVHVKSSALENAFVGNTCLQPTYSNLSRQQTSYHHWIRWYTAICHYSRQELKKQGWKISDLFKAPDVARFVNQAKILLPRIRHHLMPSAWQPLCFSSSSYSSPRRKLKQSRPRPREVPEVLISAVWRDTSPPKPFKI